MKSWRALIATVVVAACGRSPFGLVHVDGDASVPDDARAGSLPPPREGGAAHPRGPDASTTAPDATRPPPRMRDASRLFESGAGPGSASDTGAPSDAASIRDGAPIRDAAPIRDGSRNAAPDVAPPPDCTCPPGDFTLDAVMGTTPIHLAAPYVLNIYCEETAVTLGHPSCGEVYRLSGCAALHYGPPCLYMGVDLGSGFLLGSFVDANGQPWDLLSGIIAPDPPDGRVATGNFAATLRPRAGGDVVSMSGNFRACAIAFPACGR